LVLTDVQGCRSTNLISQRVRVAPRPSFNLQGALNQTICAGDTLQLSAATTLAGGEDLLVSPNTGTFAIEGIRSDSLPLPDGTGIPYESSLFLTEFSPGQVLTSANDLEGICVNIEHSWARDIEIVLTCPNGQSIILHDHPGNFGGEFYLGEPNDNDNFIPVPGLGYDYCWTNAAPNPTWLEYADANFFFGGTLPPGDYTPFEPFSNLIGCPLNGEWTLTATDSWPIDNGYLFSWSVNFQDYLYPNVETFTPGFVTWGWNNHPSIFFSTMDSIAASPQNAGAAGYTFVVQDSFGCVWDTLITFNVLPPTHPNCFQCANIDPVLVDTTVCPNQLVQLNVSSVLAPSQ
jgi:hypothetical protein